LSNEGERQGRPSFLKKSSKKLLPIGAEPIQEDSSQNKQKFFASFLQKRRPFFLALSKLATGVIFDFGGIVVFYALMYTLGLKAAIGGTMVFVVIDAVRRRVQKLGFPKIYVLSTSLVIVFGLIDIYAKNPFMVRWEGVLTNLAVMSFFLAGARGRSVFQELAEQQSGQVFTDPHMLRLFRVMTVLWALYFLAKAGFDVWTGLTMPLAKALAVRQVVGLVGMAAMVVVTVRAEKFLHFLTNRGWIA
jgi:intracellular septation protein A